MVSKARAGVSRALGTDAGHGKGAQCSGPGLVLLVAQGKGGSGGGGGGGG